MSNILKTDAEKGLTFLLWLNADASLYLESHQSVGAAKPKGKEFPPRDAASAKQFVTSNNSDSLRRNIYFLPNAEFLSGRRNKSNISASRFLWVDLDCKDYPGDLSEQLDTVLGLLCDDKLRPNGVPEPTAFWFTGGGYQALWRLDEPIPVDQVENMNKAMLDAFEGAPGPVDACRLLRLPGTVNWLSDTKRKHGREPTNSLLMDPVQFAKPPQSYSIDNFKLRLSDKKGSVGSSKGNSVIDPSALEALPLPEDLNEILPSNLVWAEAIATGKNPPDKNYSSRSELVIACTLWMLGENVQPGHVLSIIINPDLGISAHVRDQSNPLRYAQRQVARAMGMIAARREDWPHKTEKGTPVERHPDNIRYAFASLGVDARHNLFLAADEVTGFGLEQRDLNDIGDILSSQFQRELEFKATAAAIKGELVAVAHEKSYHPVIDYLDGLEWDGTPRIDTWLNDYCSVADTELNREFGAKFLIAGVRRIRQPGVKFDTMLILEGAQGTGKSSLIEVLAVQEEWFCGSLDLNADAKIKAEMLRRAWIVECQELDGARKATLDAVKKFLSTRSDTYRAAYARNAADYPRHCIIFGTTNEERYLRDPTGNRRFWSVQVGAIDLTGFGSDIDQLWAEAVRREAANESIVLSAHLWDEAKELQQRRMVEDPFMGVLEDWFSTRSGRVSMDSVKLLLSYSSGRMSSIEAKRVGDIMDRLGWTYCTQRLHDLGRSEATQRKGFAKGATEDRKTEWIAVSDRNGIVTLSKVEKGGENDAVPF